MLEDNAAFVLFKICPRRPILHVSKCESTPLCSSPILKTPEVCEIFKPSQ